jgi:hypothetical protein
LTVPQDKGKVGLVKSFHVQMAGDFFYRQEICRMEMQRF